MQVLTSDGELEFDQVFIRALQSAAVQPDPHDHCSWAGALRLKARLEDYWRERGYSVKISVADAGYHPAVRTVRFELRSDMRNGFPIRAMDDVSGDARETPAD